ncbi:MAG: histidine phosphatase family protein [Gemmatimonadetes bacterium]|nr:histidine phosphatase family protein [Gemmatimonadota bacterium]
MRNLLRPLLMAAALLSTAPLAAQDSTVVVLVRHAEKAAVEPGNNDPPLSEAGAARAAALREALHGMHLDAVIATERQRTQATARPAAEAHGLAPEIVSLRHGPAHVDSVAAAVRRHAGHTVLVAGHSNTVPAIVHALGGPRLPDLCEAEYANLFVLVLKPGAEPRLERRSYGVPDPPRADVCPAHP